MASCCYCGCVREDGACCSMRCMWFDKASRELTTHGGEGSCLDCQGGDTLSIITQHYTKSMSFRPIQIALIAEATMNVYGAIAIYADPSSMLKLMLPPTTLHSAALKAQTEWVAALTLGVTLPILLCIPEGREQTVARRTLYITFMGFEACMIATALAQYIRGDHGFNDRSVLGTMAIFAFFTGLRVFFLFIRPDWIRTKAKAV